MSWLLVTKDDHRPAVFGGVYKSFRGEDMKLKGGTPPHKPSSTGKITVLENGITREYNPGVLMLEWIELP